MSRSQPPTSVRRFNDLIPHRVREVLLVSSPYDAFILQEDGHLTERMFFEYREVSLSSSPRFTHAANGEEAIHLLEERRFELILAMTSLADMDINAFGRRVKGLRPGRPVVLLALDRHELNKVRDSLDPNAIDGFFLWTGDINILLAVIKWVEDRQNVDHDVLHGNVRVILMLEDSPQYYSSFLGLLYKEMMRQSLSLYAEGLNELYRTLYMKSRPKVLHARSYEEGEALFQRYQKNILAVISDFSIPRHGRQDRMAGLAFARYAISHDPDLPILLQSADAENRVYANQLRAAFLDKNSTSLLAEIREFMSTRLGFGDFIFRTPDGKESDRARDLRELEEKLHTIPEELFIYHASHNHISIWLMARSEFELAEELRPKKISDFASVEACRQHVIRLLQETRQRVHRGIISDFHPDHFENDHFSRMGDGYLGGKARGLAFLYQTLADMDQSEFVDLKLAVPQTIVITTDGFDNFLETNSLREFAYEGENDEEITRQFLAARLPAELLGRLELVVARLRGPLAIRSSSLLEDSMHQPFAGIYSTLMIPNQNSDPEKRLRELCSAIKLVYASTFMKNAKSYLAATGNRIEEEKMAVILQRVVGGAHGRRFYPHFSGIAQSHNYYPIGPQTSEDGIVHLALGLGRKVVDGGLALRFCPRYPQLVPAFARPESVLDSTQRGFWALDLDRECAADADLYATLQHYDLGAAEDDGTLAPIASVYSADDERIRDDLSIPGPRVVTFNNILKHKLIPLPEVLMRMLEVTQHGLGCAVEMEFACDMGDWGRRMARGQKRSEPKLHLLQVRPLVSRAAMEEVAQRDMPRETLLCVSTKSLGHGLLREIRDIVYVRPDTWDASRNRAISYEVGDINAVLKLEQHPYILIGPGRWGTADEWLGIPVQWSQISAARVIVEASPHGYDVDPSQGSHFFHNITAQGIGYLTIPPASKREPDESESFLDWKWLAEQGALTETPHLRHLRLAEPLTVILDGRNSKGMVAKPESMEQPGARSEEPMIRAG